MGGKIDNQINNGGGPYVFCINGQNHHKIGSLILVVGQHPKFAQLYIYDTHNKVSNRLNVVTSGDRSQDLDTTIIEGLLKMLDENNQLTKVF